MPADTADGLAALCFGLGSCGLQSEDDREGVRLTAYFPPDAVLQRVARELAAGLAAAGLRNCPVEWEWEGERDWLREWRAFYRPVWATDRIVVHPPWLPVKTESGQMAISIEPRMAFGTGGHESTRLCLQGIDELACAGARCLDVGTGSGVLTIALTHLGAAHVLAVDVDEVSVENARYNIAENLETWATRTEVREGSVEAVPERGFDLIVANIESHTLRPLLVPIQQRLAPRGRALFSGLLEREGAAFESWLREADFEPTHHWASNGWVCIAALNRADA